MTASLPADLAFPAAVVAKATLLLAAAAIASFILARRRAPAAARHLVWTLAVCGLLALPFFSATLPGWRLGFLALPVDPEPAAVLLPGTVDDEPVVATTSGRVFVDAPGAAITVETREAASAAPVERAGMAGMNVDPWTLALGIYLLGVTILFARLALGEFGVRRLARDAWVVDDPEWTGLARDLAWMLDVDRPVTLLRSARATMPMTWGVRRPVVLLPDEAERWPEERRRVVLLHELAHVARHDCLTQSLAALACALYWFHPGSWYAARRLRVERELACDDRVLSAGTRAREYASHLLEVARAFRPAALTGAVAVSMARPSQLEGRLLAVLDERSRHAISRGAALVSAALALVLVLPLAAMRPGAPPAEDRPGAAAERVAGSAAEAPGTATTEMPGDEAGATQEDYRREFRVNLGERLTVDVLAGSVQVEGVDRGFVSVDAEVEGPRDLRVWAERTADGVRVVARPVRGRDARGEVRLKVRVPRRFDVEVRGSGAGVQISDVRGTFTGSTAGGGLALARTAGTLRMSTGGGGAMIQRSALRGTLRTQGGGVMMDGNDGDLDVISDGGAVVGSSPDGSTRVGEWDDDAREDARARARAGTGATEVRGWADGGPVNISQSGGPVTLAEAPGGANVSTGGGAIRIGRAAGDVNASTGGGDVVVENCVDGAVRASTGAGDMFVRLSGAGGEVMLSTGRGAITLTLPADFSGDVEVETAYTRGNAPTRVISDFPLTVTQSPDWETEHGTPRKRVRGRGRLGSGRHTVRVSAVNGDVRIRRAGSARASTRLDGRVNDSGSARTETQASGRELPGRATPRPSRTQPTRFGTVDSPSRQSRVWQPPTTAQSWGTGEPSTSVRAMDSAWGGTGQPPTTVHVWGTGKPSTTARDTSGFSFLTGDEEGRAAAVGMMGRHGEPNAVAEGMAGLALADPSVKVQLAAVAALGRLPGAVAAPHLSRLAREHPTAEVRQAAQSALRR